MNTKPHHRTLCLSVFGRFIVSVVVVTAVAAGTTALAQTDDNIGWHALLDGSEQTRESFRTNRQLDPAPTRHGDNAVRREHGQT